MTGLCKGYSPCKAPPTCYRHYDSSNDCVYYDHTPNTEVINVNPYAPTSFICADGQIRTGANYAVACGNEYTSQNDTVQTWTCPDGTKQSGTTLNEACVNHMVAKWVCPDGTTQLGLTVDTACIGHDTKIILKSQDVIPKSSTSTKTVIPTSNNQYPITTTVPTETIIPITSTSAPLTKISNPVSTAINVIKSKTTAIPNALFNFYSMYRNYLLGLIILAIFVVIIAKGDKKHE